MCGVVVTDGLGSVVGLDSRNLGTGGPRGLGQTGTERGPTVDQSTGRLLVLLGRLVALFGWKECHFKGRRKEPAIEREREREGGGNRSEGEGTRERVQTSIGETLFVCGFTDVSVDFEHNTRDFWRWQSRSKGSDDSSDSREPEKGHEGDGTCRKKRREVGREVERRLQRAVECVGGAVFGNAKLKREEEGRRGRKGE